MNAQPPTLFEIPNYYNKKMKISAISHHNKALFRKATQEERKVIDVLLFEMKKIYKLPVCMIDNYITEHKINLHETIRKMYDYDNASQYFISNIIKVDNQWVDFDKCDVEVYMNKHPYIDIEMFHSYKRQLRNAFNKGFDDDDYTEFFELYYKGM